MDHITVPKVENVKLLDRYIGKKPANGSLYLTATHLIYVEASGAARKETWIALHHIATVEKLPVTSLGCPLILRCKNFRVAHFVLESDVVCHEIYISLLKLSQPELPEDLYAFSYNPKFSKDMRENGWKLIDQTSDFGRMGIPNRYWTITDANRNYEICNTYPPEIVVPKSVTLGTVVGSSKFRSKERVPVLSYLYKENNAAICRCSQPLSGFYTRCIDDELLLEAIRQTNPRSQFLYVVDTRPKLNALANRAAGKGYENEDNYANIRFRFMSIENIHVMRSSLQKLLEVCELKTPTMSEFLSGLESSGWLRHIKAIMDAGIFIAKAVKVEKTNVLVHCSDGWDRTAQVCSVASILLDPFYRTFKGLMILIEKEWICMGHKFSQRFWCGMYNRFDKGLQPKQSMLESLLEIKKQRSMLEADVHKLEKIWHILLLIMRIVLLQSAKVKTSWTSPRSSPSCSLMRRRIPTQERSRLSIKQCTTMIPILWTSFCARSVTKDLSTVGVAGVSLGHPCAWLLLMATLAACRSSWHMVLMLTA
ncbi:myotubularin-related protein 8 isoform X2 [Cervus canadensis]|uniref:myotubularin-related protein 8 isoform X2 n=1 Tax=Cervus canadensis TaxID=1574408 RepID=UPI001CA3766A|nr:myotubularin-related protein 8 isoform X2 [Cervus canadensis]